MSMANGLLPRAGLVNGFQWQGDFDEFSTIDHDVIFNGKAVAKKVRLDRFPYSARLLRGRARVGFGRVWPIARVARLYRPFRQRG